jgi:hypothetical protein
MLLLSSIKIRHALRVLSKKKNNVYSLGRKWKKKREADGCVLFSPDAMQLGSREGSSHIACREL